MTQNIRVPFKLLQPSSFVVRKAKMLASWIPFENVVSCTISRHGILYWLSAHLLLPAASNSLLS